MRRRFPSSTLFPYTTLFRSWLATLRLGACPIRSSHIHGWFRQLQFQLLELITWRLERDHAGVRRFHRDRKSTRLNSSHPSISYAVFCLKKKTSSCLFQQNNR